MAVHLASFKEKIHIVENKPAYSLSFSFSLFPGISAGWILDYLFVTVDMSNCVF